MHTYLRRGHAILLIHLHHTPEHKVLPQGPPCLHATQVAVKAVDNRWPHYYASVGGVNRVRDAVRHGREPFAAYAFVLHEAAYHAPTSVYVCMCVCIYIYIYI
jgi:hypothetical protein